MAPLYKRYQDDTPIGVKSFNAFFGVALFATDLEDDCDFVSAWWNGEYYYTFHRTNIKYTPSGKAFFYKGNMKIYLEEVIRTKWQ